MYYRRRSDNDGPAKAFEQIGVGDALRRLCRLRVFRRAMERRRHGVDLAVRISVFQQTDQNQTAVFVAGCRHRGGPCDQMAGYSGFRLFAQRCFLSALERLLGPAVPCRPAARTKTAGVFSQQSDLPRDVRFGGSLTRAHADREPRRDGVYAVRLSAADAGNVADRQLWVILFDLLVRLGRRYGGGKEAAVETYRGRLPCASGGVRLLRLRPVGGVPGRF